MPRKPKSQREDEQRQAELAANLEARKHYATNLLPILSKAIDHTFELHTDGLLLSLEPSWLHEDLHLNEERLKFALSYSEEHLDNMYYLEGIIADLEQKRQSKLERERLRFTALSKLSPAERDVLGL